VAIGLVGWTSGAFSSAAANGANNWSADTLAPPSGFSVTQTCTSTTETIAFRGTTSNTGQDGLVLFPPAGLVAGDVMIAQVANRTGASPSSAPAGWTQVRTDSSGATVTSTVYWKVATASEPWFYVWSLSGSWVAGGLAAYDGVSTTGPIDAHGSQTGNSSTATTPQLTTTVANTRLVHLFTKRQEVLPAPTGTTSRWGLATAGGANQANASGADEAFVGPGTTPARTSSASTFGSEWVAQTVALRPQIEVTVGASASWTATPSTFASGYKLRRYVGTTLQNEQVITPRTTTTAIDSALVNATAYTYKLIAYHGNWSSAELTASLTPAC